MNQKGFSLVEGLTIVLVISIISFGGYYVWNENQKDDSTMTATTEFIEASNQESDSSGTSSGGAESEIPENWTQYSNSEYGLSFSYPPEIGELNQENYDSNESLLYYAVTQAKQDALSASTVGQLIVRVDKRDNYVKTYAKYGPNLEYMNQKWIVTDKNYGDINSGDLSIGSVHLVDLAKTTNRDMVYDFSFSDEGCYWSSWIIPKEEYVIEIVLPPVCGTSQDMSLPSDEDLDEYKERSNIILSSLLVN